MSRNILAILFLLSFVPGYGQVQVQRSEQSQIAQNGLVGLTRPITTINLPEAQIDAANNRWQANTNKMRFAEPIPAAIDVLKAAVWQKEGTTSSLRLRINAPGATGISIYFDTLELSERAEMFVYNPLGTIIVGPITYKERVSSGDLWTSTVFPGSSLVIEIRVPSTETSLNKVHAKKILYGIQSSTTDQILDSLSGPGFGESHSCNVNAICPAAANYSLQRRGVAVSVDERGGRSTAFLIKNACGTTRPFILTAYHALKTSSTTIVNTSNSSYEFLWISPTCSTTTNTTSTWLFQGATVRARWANTDFALLELNQAVLSSHNLTFLGWSRSATAPTSSATLHHPQGDIMKFASESSPAVYGNVGTFTNTAWRVVMDIGTVESGSSGAPMLNQNGLVVGQQFSTSQANCNPQSTGGVNFGRFDLSWADGPDFLSRLHQWLDPLNTNLMSMTATSSSALKPYSLTLTLTGGIPVLCSGSTTYTLNGVPTGEAISWQISNTAVCSLSTVGNKATLHRIGDGTVTLTATVGNSSCFTNNSRSVSVAVGKPIVSISANMNGPCNGSYQPWQLNASANQAITSWLWSKDNPASDIIIYNPNSPSTNISVNGGGGVSMNVNSACGTARNGVTVYGNCSFGFMSASPNPTTGEVTLSISEDANFVQDSRSYSKTAKPLNHANFVRRIKVFDSYGVLVKSYNYKKAVPATIKIYLGDLRSGIYYIQLHTDKMILSEKLILRK